MTDPESGVARLDDDAAEQQREVTAETRLSEERERRARHAERPTNATGPQESELARCRLEVDREHAEAPDAAEFARDARVYAEAARRYASEARAALAEQRARAAGMAATLQRIAARL